MKFIKNFAFLLIILIFTSNIFSQGKQKANKDWDGTKPEVLKGAASIVFIYAPFVSGSLGSAPAGSYGSFVDSTETQINNMSGIGFQYYFNNNMAIVLGLRYGYNKSENTDLVSHEITASTSEFGFSGDLNYHFSSLYSVSPYVGFNCNLGLFSSSYESVATNSSGDKSEVNWNGFNISGGLNVGFDWYFTPGLSLGGKYTMRTSIVTSPEKETTIQSSGIATTTTQKGPSEFGWESGVTSIILNVHF